MKLIKLPQVLALTAKSRTGHYADIKDGLMTPPVRLSIHSVAWPEHEITAINSARIAGKSNEEIRALVRDLVAARSKSANAPVVA